MNRRCLRQGIRLVEVLLVIGAIGILVGLLLPVIQVARDNNARIWSQNNLKQIGIGINKFGVSHNNTLPNAGTQPGTTAAPYNGSSYWFCGGAPTGNLALAVPAPYIGAAAAPTFTGGILSQMEGNTKNLLAWNDPSTSNNPGLACSYSIPAYWGTLSNGTGNLFLPASFPRGTSQCIGVAEMCSNNVTFNQINAFGPVGAEIYSTKEELLANLKTNPNANNGSAAPGTRTIGNPATAFSLGGLQAVFMDGSVKVITPAENTATGFSANCHPDDCPGFRDTTW
jgi:hypothetical protein